MLPPRPARPNEQWCMDFMAHRLEDGRQIRILTVEDIFTRECVALEITLSLTSARVISVLEVVAVNDTAVYLRFSKDLNSCPNIDRRLRCSFHLSTLVARGS
jgi:putative transposase